MSLKPDPLVNLELHREIKIKKNKNKKLFPTFLMIPDKFTGFRRETMTSTKQLHAAHHLKKKEEEVSVTAPGRLSI